MATQSEAPVVETRRFTADEILQGTLDNARNELRRSLVKLGFSGIAGGITMGLTALGVSSIRAFVGDGGWRDLVAYLAYPLGFIAVIIGRAQLFTENTLYPVVLVLDERKHLVRMLRLWGTVFLANVIGATIFAVLVAKSSALHPDILIGDGDDGIKRGFRRCRPFLLERSHWRLADRAGRLDCDCQSLDHRPTRRHLPADLRGGWGGLRTALRAAAKFLPRLCTEQFPPTRTSIGCCPPPRETSAEEP